MIQGTVTSDKEPIIRLSVRNATGQGHELDAIVDTGFTGWLTLPRDVITSLNLPWRDWGAGTLADGSETFFDVYDGIVVWDGNPVATPIAEADSDPLVGMRLSEGYRIVIENIDGGPVQIERL